MRPLARKPPQQTLERAGRSINLIADELRAIVYPKWLDNYSARSERLISSITKSTKEAIDMADIDWTEIEVSRYNELVQAEHKLNCLLAAGIDNTEAYDEGMSAFQREEDGEDL